MLGIAAVLTVYASIIVDMLFYLIENRSAVFASFQMPRHMVVHQAL